MASISSSGPRKRPRRSTMQEGQDEDAMTDHGSSISNCQHSPGDTSIIEGCQPHDSGEDNNNTLIKDSRFYFPEADCAIRVGNTLFRVHRFLLARDSSAFEDMFTLPSQSTPRNDPDRERVEGYSDSNPIILHGESDDNFRELVSVLYALPAELHILSTDVPHLLKVCSVANKYHFTSTETWAVDMLFPQVTSDLTPDDHNIESCSSSMMSRILEVARLCGHKELENTVVKKWKFRLREGELDPLQAVRTAETHSLQGLGGASYYTLLQCLDEKLQYSSAQPNSENDLSDTGMGTEHTTQVAFLQRPNPDLTSHERRRLLSGHLSLTHLWDRLRSQPPKFQRADGCTYHQRGCLLTWATIWDEISRSSATLNRGNYRSTDVVGNLMCMRMQLLGNSDLQCALTPGCRKRAMDAVTELISNVESGLAEHFVGLD